MTMNSNYKKKVLWDWREYDEPLDWLEEECRGTSNCWADLNKADNDAFVRSNARSLFTPQKSCICSWPPKLSCFICSVGRFLLEDGDSAKELLSEKDTVATTPSGNGNRDESSPLQRQEMESSIGAGAIATEAAPLPENPYTNHETGGMTMPAPPDIQHSQAQEPDMAGDLSFVESPESTRYVDHIQSSNVRETTQKMPLSEPDSEAFQAANSLTNINRNTADGQGFQPLKDLRFPYGVPSNVMPDENFDEGILQESYDNAEADPHSEQGYAKLVFGDGDFFIKTHDVMLGRNMEMFEQLRLRKKQERRAREELDTYRKEPSQPSQPGDEDQHGNPSNSSQSLEGRPAPPSNFSEHGGSVWYPHHADGEAEMQLTKPKRRVSHFSKSSSTTSVAPASLHPSAFSNTPNLHNEPQVRTYAFIPIHTQIPEDISKISKEHLLFSFNFKEEQWELKIVGNRAFLNEELFERETVIPLEHNDEIMIASVSMVFKLPDNFRRSPGLSRGTFSRDGEDEEVDDEDSDLEETALSTSPIRRLSNAMEAEDSKSEEEEEQQAGARSRKKPNLKIKSKPEKARTKVEKAKKKEKMKKSNVKAEVKRESSTEEPHKAVKKVEKGKKPKAADKDIAEAVKDAKASPAPAPAIEPGSALEGIPLDQIPEKRKGPGRPPKSGHTSKRDQTLAMKRQREYEKRGEFLRFDDAVVMVRREQKAKDLQAKMLASGDLQPGDELIMSIEADALAGTSKSRDSLTNGTHGDSTKRSSPKAKQVVRDMSPVKPEAECTEDELKKPDRTYVHILDEILQRADLEQADLPTIYNLMEKRYPYYKYRCSTTGWQSSVRHNLLQSSRFKESGKSGKGRFWTIDHDSPLEKEKKRRASPPKAGMHNGPFIPGQMPPPQYGQTPYGNPYGPHPGPAYYSPYAQQGQFHGNAHPGASQGPGPNGAPPITPYSALVQDITKSFNEYVAGLGASPAEFQRQQQIMTDIVEFFSEYHRGAQPSAAMKSKVANIDHRAMFAVIERQFRKHKPDIAFEYPVWTDGAIGHVQSGPHNGADPSTVVRQSDGADGGVTTQPVNWAAPASLPNPSIDGDASLATSDQARGTKRAAEDEQDEQEAKREKVSDS